MSDPFFLAERPACAFPDFEPGLTKLVKTPAGRLSSRRSTQDKTGQATRQRLRVAILKKHGPVCHICLQAIDIDLKWPNPRSFTRDHVKPRSLGGTDAIANQRPAHKRCNEQRGNRLIGEARS